MKAEWASSGLLVNRDLCKTERSRFLKNSEATILSVGEQSSPNNLIAMNAFYIAINFGTGTAKLPRPMHPLEQPSGTRPTERNNYE